MAVDTPTRRSCAVMPVHRRLLNTDPDYATARTEIENVAFAVESGARTIERTEVARIPVVVHVVWNTQAQNISAEQVRSQIDVLNRDFRRRNPDAGQVPGPFKPRAADCRVEFFLAKKDVVGQPTDGITRTRTSKTTFDPIEEDVKSRDTGGADPWAPTRYLNIWVCPLGGGLLGYAQFPGGPERTDGVVILTQAFGDRGNVAAPFDKGRTTTHEVGHWLNLYHIWGDDGTGCSGSDYVADTPNQADENYGCPTFPQLSCNNGPNGDMFMNYMDYTDDACMHLFTKGQSARMDATLAGPRRAVLQPMPAFPGVMKRDDHHKRPNVDRVQRQLRDRFKHRELAVDGVFGAKTEAAVERFQRNRHTVPQWRLAVDGIVGPRTWAALFA
jgi:peptidoglycan hydrolase-like protein with peptidoglycan-binding domain